MNFRLSKAIFEKNLFIDTWHQQRKPKKKQKNTNEVVINILKTNQDIFMSHRLDKKPPDDNNLWPIIIKF